MQNLVEKYGIDESKKVFSIVATGITAVSNLDSNQDGHIKTIEVLNAIQVVAIKVIGGTPNLIEFRKEATDYSEAEKAILVDGIAADVEMPRKKVEVLVERALAIVLDTVDLVIDAQRPDEDFE